MDIKHILEYQRQEEMLVKAAILAYVAAELAKSNYRGFYVGCSVLAYNGYYYQIFTGINQMDERGGIKICAEQQAIGNAREAGYLQIIAITVVGNCQRDGTSGHYSITLHPCGGCRRYCSAFSGVSSETIVLTVRIDNPKIREEHTFQQIVLLHNVKTWKEIFSSRISSVYSQFKLLISRYSY